MPATAGAFVLALLANPCRARAERAAERPVFTVPAAATLRTPADVEEAERSTVAPALPARAVSSSPLGATDLAARKAASSNSPPRQRFAASRSTAVGAVPAGTAPVLKGVNANGLAQTTAAPPDAQGAAGRTQFVEVANQRLAVYSKEAQPSLLESVSLASFFGYGAAPLFHPRVVFDATWNRWVVSAAALHEASNAVQNLLIAVSKTASATGAFWVYRFNADVDGNGEFADFPQLGMDQDAVVMTANVFDGDAATTYLTSHVMTFAKARAYNGLALDVVVFDAGSFPSIAPSVVLDQNRETFLVQAPPSGSTLNLFTLLDSSRGAGATLAGPAAISVAAYDVPGDAPQPGTTDTLDTGDARFLSAGTQNGDVVWQVHTIGPGIATPRWYRIDTQALMADSGTFYGNYSSWDFNATIAANVSGDMFVTWSATDPANGVNAQVWFAGKLAGDLAPNLTGTVLFRSPTFYSPGLASPEPWGLYSAIAIDPVDELKAWLVNEKINSKTAWGTRIGRIGF